jgi:hypothetical protein
MPAPMPFQGAGDRIDDPLAQAGEAEDEEDNAGEKHGAKRHLPSLLHAKHHAEGEEGVEAHARRHGHRPLRPEAHDQRADGGGQDGGHEHGAEIHARFGQDRWIDNDDIGHGQKCGQTG